MKNKKIRYTLLILAAVIFVVILVIILTFKGRVKKELRILSRLGLLCLVLQMRRDGMDFIMKE